MFGQSASCDISMALFGYYLKCMSKLVPGSLVIRQLNERVRNRVDELAHQPFFCLLLYCSLVDTVSGRFSSVVDVMQ